ncbi:MAG: TolC family protein [Flavobacteriales bacterium]|nr:TolC family protein [Flavobacteriales bacterium]MCB0785795.1 TolC family protein [Flavobacteriales bacterium]MCB0808523.1 TolC family protein [Flavobacteriales bacterium]MCB0813770.1 TolC family protein [Flavobacteriales bacterium]MCB0815941.1 TolC family protein [Flavobacteriales bacterium]
MRAARSIRHLLHVVLVASPLLSTGQTAASVRSLEECIELALANDKRVLAADIDLRMAEARVDEQQANLLPKVRGVADMRHYADLPYQLLPASFFGGPEGVYREIQFGTPDNIALNVQAQLPLVDVGSWEGINVAREAERMAGMQRERSREDVVLDLSNAYYNAQVLQARRTFLDSNLLSTEAMLRNVELLHAQLLARGTDVDRLRLQRDQLRTQRERVVAQHDQVLDLLRLMMGLPPDAPLATEPASAPVQQTQATPKATAGLRIAEQGVLLHQAEIRLLKRSRLPSLHGYGLYGNTGFGPIGSESRYDLYPVSYFGATLQVPLFNGTVITQKVRQKELELERAGLLRDAMADREGLEQRRATMDEALALRTLSDAEAQMVLAERIRRSTLLLHTEGLATLTDLVLADQAVREGQQLYIDALVQLRKAQLELASLNGMLLNERP